MHHHANRRAEFKKGVVDGLGIISGTHERLSVRKPFPNQAASY